MLAYRPSVDEYQGQRRLTLFIEHCEYSLAQKVGITHNERPL